MLDAATIAQLATAAGTLILGVATFSAVRSSQRSAHVAERSLLLGIRPVLAPSREGDPEEIVAFGDGHRLTVAGGGAAVECEGERIYLAAGLRNVGPGLAVLHGWHLQPGPQSSSSEHAQVEEFRRLLRDLYVPASDSGFWQGAIRDADDPFRSGLREAVAAGGPLRLDLLYGDHEGGQRTISRFALSNEDGGGWECAVTRHWRLDGNDPR